MVNQYLPTEFGTMQRVADGDWVLKTDYQRLIGLLQRIDEHTFNCPYDTTCCPDCAKLRIEAQATWSPGAARSLVGFANDAQEKQG